MRPSTFAEAGWAGAGAAAPSTGRRGVAHAGDSLVRERLAAFQRYAELVAAQEAAVESGDLDGAEALLDRAAVLQAELGPAFTTAVPLDGSGDAATELSHLLRGALSTSERIQAGLHALRAETALSVRRAVAGQRTVRGYAPPAATDAGAGVDLRL
ncbi:MAG TPA: hypothetical protein VLH75_03165 [Longimicrobiales bacterium]|nr:hypothetical protein [Longimicrobiales bacterium]